MIMNERSIVEELLNRPPYDGSEECDNLFMEALRDELVSTMSTMICIGIL